MTQGDGWRLPDVPPTFEQHCDLESGVSRHSSMVKQTLLPFGTKLGLRSKLIDALEPTPH